MFSQLNVGALIHWNTAKNLVCSKGELIKCNIIAHKIRLEAIFASSLILYVPNLHDACKYWF